MALVEQVTSIAVTFGIAAFFVLVIIGGAVGLFVLQRRREKKAGIVVSAQEQRLDYSRFKRTDAQEYAKFDDIVDFGWGGAIVLEGGRRFVAGLAVTGYDYAMASAEERYRSLVGMQTVANVIAWPVQVHQDSRRADLTAYIKSCEDRIAKMRDAIDAYISEKQGITAGVNLLMENQGQDDRSVRNAMRHYQERLAYLNREIEAMHNLIREQEAQIEDMKKRSENFSPIRSHKYMIDWIYRPQEYSTRQLEGPEIIKEAKELLQRRLNTLANALSSTGVSTHPMSADELLTAEYVHYHPISGGNFRIEDIRDSMYFYPYMDADNSELMDEVEEQMALVQKYQEEYENDLRAQAEIEFLEEEARKEEELAMQEEGEINRPAAGEGGSEEPDDRPEFDEEEEV